MNQVHNASSAIIVGGGLIGCSIAYELSKAGIACTVIDQGALLEEASIAAAGMLGAHVEIHHPGDFFEMCKRSRSLYASWAEELQERTGISPQYIAQGIVRAALTEEDEQELRSRMDWIGEDVSWLSPADLREIEHRLTEDTRGGLYFAEDHQIHPVYLARALRSAVIQLGCVIRERTPVLELLTEGSRVYGVRTAQNEVHADTVIIAAGAWSGSLLKPLGKQLNTFPVKGQCFSVRTGGPLLTRTAFTKGCYIVPKLDGTMLIGATQEEAGFDKKVTVEAISKLHQTASRLIPALQQAEFVASWAGLRPGTPDGLPYLGRFDGLDGLIAATGHYRNGILLAPITGRLIRQLICNQPLDLDLRSYSPDRSA